MTLAAILLLGISCAASAPRFGSAMPHQTAPQSTPQSAPANAPPTQDQGTPPPATSSEETKTPAQTTAPSPSTSAQAPAEQKPSATKRRRHKKKASSGCGDLPAAPVPTATGSTATSTPPADPASSGPASSDPASSASNTSAQSSGTPAAPKPCPPPRIIVRHGGTAEPSIQLAGGPSNSQASHQRDVVNQLRGATEANLKRIAGQQLNSGQQDTVAQIRQFMDQSKTAVESGDLDRARTLAWKAELLSEELAKAQK